MVISRFLLDANVLSEPLKPLPNSHVLAEIEAHRAESVMAARTDFSAFEGLRIENWWA